MTAALRRAETPRWLMPAMTATKATATTASKEMLDSMAITRAQVVATWASQAATPAEVMTPAAADLTSAGSVGPIPMVAASILAGPILAVGPTPAAETTGFEARGAPRRGAGDAAGAARRSALWRGCAS